VNPLIQVMMPTGADAAIVPKVSVRYEHRIFTRLGANPRTTKNANEREFGEESQETSRKFRGRRTGLPQRRRQTPHYQAFELS